MLDVGVPSPSPKAAPLGLSSGGALLDLVAVSAAIALGEGLRPGAFRGAGRLTRPQRAWLALRHAHDGSIGDSATRRLGDSATRRLGDVATIGAATITLVLATTLR